MVRTQFVNCVGPQICLSGLWQPSDAPRRVSERSVQMLPVGSPVQDVVLTTQLDRVWLIVLPDLRMGTREASSTAAFEV